MEHKEKVIPQARPDAEATGAKPTEETRTYVKPGEDRPVKRKRRTASKQKTEKTAGTEAKATAKAKKRIVTDAKTDEELSEKQKRMKTARGRYQEARKDPTGKKLSLLRLGVVHYVARTRRMTWKSISQRTKELSKKDPAMRYYPEQTMEWWRVTDDCMLSQVYCMMKAMDVKASVNFVYPETKDVFIKAPQFVAKGNLMPEKTKPLGYGAYGDALTDPARRLHFLAEFIQWTGMKFYLFARKAHKSVNRMEEWLEKDDIKISRLYQIAEAFDTTLEWNLTYEKSENEEDKNANG